MTDSRRAVLSQVGRVRTLQRVSKHAIEVYSGRLVPTDNSLSEQVQATACGSGASNNFGAESGQKMDDRAAEA